MPDQQTFKTFFETTFDMIYSLGMRFFHYDEEEALDFCQEVYLRAYDKWSSFAHRSSRSTWLYALARNLGLNRIKKQELLNLQACEVIASEDIAASIQDIPEEQILSLLNQEKLEKKIQSELSKLPHPYRLALILHYYENMSYEEISKKLDIKIGTLKSYIYRAKIILRNRLQDIAQEY